jgi:hypothetical protein
MGVEYIWLPVFNTMVSLLLVNPIPIFVQVGFFDKIQIWEIRRISKGLERVLEG